MSGSLKLCSVQPLVRYVDADRAIIDVHFQAEPAVGEDPASVAGRQVEALLRVEGDDGFNDEGRSTLVLDEHGSAGAQFEIVHPCRWWPAGMGEQPMYELTLGLTDRCTLLDHRTVEFGLTSVRHLDGAGLGRGEQALLVHGQACAIDSVVMVDRVSENRLLPVTGASLMLVRDHYATEKLYRAADRAGILMVQAVPIDASGRPESTFVQQVARLSGHPSLAGWFVGHLGRLTDVVAGRIRELDPTHLVLRTCPGVAA